MNQELCIYCGKNASVDGEGDHIISSCMGEFRGMRRFRRICNKCNQRIGSFEAVVVRCGPEAMLARAAPEIASRRGKKSKWQGAMGCPPPELTLSVDGTKLLASPPTQETGFSYILDQLVVKGDSGVRCIQLFPGMPISKIKQNVEVANVGRLNEVKYFGTRSTFNSLRDRICEAVDAREASEFDPDPPLGEKQKLGADFIVSDHYFRAIAKIALHYYLSYNSCGLTGYESLFDPIKNFILHGGDPAGFLAPKLPCGIYFGMPIGQTATAATLAPRDWQHLLMAAESSRGIAVAVRLFVGGSQAGNLHHVCLSSVGHGSDREAMGHRAIWPNGVDLKGKFIRMTVDQLFWPSTICGFPLDSWPFFVTYPTSGRGRLGGESLGIHDLSAG